MTHGYHKMYLKKPNNIPAQLCRYLLFYLFYMKPETIKIIISGISDSQL